MSKVCSNCLEVLPDDIERGIPCPNCGSTRRTITASDEHTLTISDSVSATVIRHWWKLLEVAENLYTDEYFEPAVIVAQTACEVVVDRAVFKAAGSPSDADEESAKLRSCSLRRRDDRQVFNELTGDQIGKRPFWAEYIEMSTHRNAAVHSGEAIPPTDARKGLDAARQMVEHVERHNGLQ